MDAIRQIPRSSRKVVPQGHCAEGSCASGAEVPKVLEKDQSQKISIVPSRLRGNVGVCDGSSRLSTPPKAIDWLRATLLGLCGGLFFLAVDLILRGK